MIGTIARIGTAWAATRYGQNDRSTHVAWAITMARSMPSTIEILSPISATNAVHAILGDLLARDGFEERSLTTRCGAVMRKLGLSQNASSAQ